MINFTKEKIIIGVNTLFCCECDNPIKKLNKKCLTCSVNRLRKELSEDKLEGSYYHSWQSNIAMAFVDEFKENGKYPLAFSLQENANNAAKRFLDQLIEE